MGSERTLDERSLRAAAIGLGLGIGAAFVAAAVTSDRVPAAWQAVALPVLLGAPPTAATLGWRPSGLRDGLIAGVLCSAVLALWAAFAVYGNASHDSATAVAMTGAAVFALVTWMAGLALTVLTVCVLARQGKLPRER
ncbi:MAG TPA: hypothetical protein VFY90_11305 [Tepidiformaceae bacterium]|nr:hypothetical protein [Tepidiformaceae bacterium]